MDIWTTIRLRTALFWVITQRVVVISYRRFVYTYWSHLQRTEVIFWILDNLRSTTRCIMTQKNAVLIYFAQKALSLATISLSRRTLLCGDIRLFISFSIYMLCVFTVLLTFTFQTRIMISLLSVGAVFFPISGEPKFRQFSEHWRFMFWKNKVIWIWTKL